MFYRLLATFLIGTSATLAAQSNPSFELGLDTYSANIANATPVQDDFNNDGKPDLVIDGGNSEDEITLRLGNGDGTFQPPVSIGTADSLPVELTAADFNQDGNLDVLALNSNGSFDVFYGNGNGTFQPALSVATTVGPTSVAVGDFYGDGYIDAAVADNNGNIEIYKNVAGKDFLLTSTINPTPGTTSLILKVRSGKVDGNGISDLGVLTLNAAYVLWGDGHGNFKPVRLASYAGSAGPPVPADLNFGDLNQDGMADIIVSYDCNPSTQPPPGRGPYSHCAGFDVFYGQGNQKTFFRHAVTDPGVMSADRTWAADVNGDGISDIVGESRDVGNSQSGLFIWLGHPDGSFDQTPQRYIASTDGMAGLVPGDWNRDGMIDFAEITNNGQIETYINSSNRAPCTISQINPTVTVCQPVDGTYLPSPVAVQANTYDKNPVTALQEYVDYKLVYSKDVSSFNITLSETIGPHFLVTKAWDATGLSFRSDRRITVYNGIPGHTCFAALGTANICLPSDTTSTSPVQILANGYTSYVPTAAQLYIDGNPVVNNQVGISYVQTAQSLSAGSHDLVFKLWDAQGHIYTAEKTITVK